MTVDQLYSNLRSWLVAWHVRRYLSWSNGLRAVTAEDESPKSDSGSATTAPQDTDEAWSDSTDAC